MGPNPQEIVDLVTITKKILNGKLHFLCSGYRGDAEICQNEVTKGQSKEDNGSDDSESQNYCTGCP